MDRQECDILVVGAGIAGASVAAELAEHGAGRIVVVEAESQPGYHTTGRSAAFWEECYGGPQIVPLTMASGAPLREGGFLTPRSALYLSRQDDRARVDAFMETFADSGVTISPVGPDRIAEIVPGVRPEWNLAIHQPNCADIDVAGLHQHFLARARTAGVAIRTRHRLQAASREGAGWRVDLGGGGEMRAGIIVNAAGAWADEVARACGARPLGITPYRRTVAQLRCSPAPPADLPLVLDLAGNFYFRPEGGKIWLSPHDETPSEPCDAAPEELDVAIAIDRFEKVVDWRIEAVEHKWAGLRSFMPDRAPAYGYDMRQPGFFWCAGQGGYGIQTSPAGARLSAQLLLGKPRDAMTEAVDPAPYSPSRFG